jgi:hypothetical protein
MIAAQKANKPMINFEGGDRKRVIERFVKAA